MFPVIKRLLLEPQLPSELADRLRAEGYDVELAAPIDAPQDEADLQLLAQADREQRTLVIVDEGLAEHTSCAYVDRHPASGIVRLHPGTIEELAERTIAGAKGIPQMRWIKYKYGTLLPAARALREQPKDPPDEK